MSMSRQGLIMTEDEDSTTSLGNLCQCSVNLMIKSIFSSCSEETSCVGLKRIHLSSFQEWSLALSFRCACCYGCLGSGLMAEPGHHHQMPHLTWNCGTLPGKILCPSVMLSSELPLPIFPWILLPHLLADWHRVITKCCGTYRIEKKARYSHSEGIRGSWDSPQVSRLHFMDTIRQQEMSGQEKNGTRWGQTRKNGEREREGVEEKKEKDTQHLNRNKRNVSHKSWMKGHAELWVHTRKPRATEDMQTEKISAMWYTRAF